MSLGWGRRIAVLLLALAAASQSGKAAPPRDRPGPQDQDVLAFLVSAKGTVTRVATFSRAGVASVARMKDGRLIAAHQHFPEADPANIDKVAVRFSTDDGKSWTGPTVIRLTGLPSGMRFPFDPTLVPLRDGRVRLYFTSLRGRRFEEDVPAIYSAVSRDGVDYTYEPGTRFAVPGRLVIDCAVVLHKGKFHLYAPDNGTGLRPGARPEDAPPDERPREGVAYHATSRDGLTFTRADDVQIEGRRRWLGGAQADRRRITFFGTHAPGGPGAGVPRGGVWMATSSDGQSWKLIEAPNIPGADPGAVSTRDGGWVVVATGPPRPGTPSSRRRFPMGAPGGPDAPGREPSVGEARP